MGINDATTPETVLFQDILHYKVVVVGIYPDIVAMFETPFEAGVSYSLLFAVGSHAVNDVIWFVVQPVAVTQWRAYVGSSPGIKQNVPIISPFSFSQT